MNVNSVIDIVNISLKVSTEAPLIKAIFIATGSLHRRYYNWKAFSVSAALAARGMI